MSLLVLGFIFLGRSFGLKTVYATVVMSVSLSLLERICPLTKPLTSVAASGTDVCNFPACHRNRYFIQYRSIQRRYGYHCHDHEKAHQHEYRHRTDAVDVASVLTSFFIFDAETGLFSTIGLAAKSLVIDDVIENINLCKCFNIICDNPDPICDTSSIP